MRPAGEIRLALLQACRELVTADRAPTVREIAERAQVGYAAAFTTVINMRVAGQLCVVRKRRVAHCNRRVSEFAPAEDFARDGQFAQALNAAPLQAAMQAWG